MMSNEFDEIIAEVSQEAREVTVQARSLIESVYPAVVEVPWPKQRVIQDPGTPISSIFRTRA
jgi:hypothetical protein